MEVKELRELSSLSQIEISESELLFFLATFANLEVMIANANFATNIEGVTPMDRILTNHLELDDLRELNVQHQVYKLGQAQLGTNATLSEDGKFRLPRAQDH